MLKTFYSINFRLSGYASKIRLIFSKTACTPVACNGNTLDYDANGQRIKKQNSDGEFTYYINKFYEIDNGTSTSYFFRDDERVAKQTSGDMEWYLSDHLGSTYLMIDENGLDVERTDYFPYGQVRSGGLEKYGFTGQENDADTGLMYYGAFAK